MIKMAYCPSNGKNKCQLGPKTAAIDGAVTATECDAHCPVCPTVDTWKLFASPPSSPGVRVNFRDCSESQIWAVPTGNALPSPRLWPQAHSLLAHTPTSHRWLKSGRQKRKQTSIKRKKKTEEYPATAGWDWAGASQYFRPAVCWHITARTMTFALKASIPVVVAAFPEQLKSCNKK